MVKLSIHNSRAPCRRNRAENVWRRKSFKLINHTAWLCALPALWPQPRQTRSQPARRKITPGKIPIAWPLWTKLSDPASLGVFCLPTEQRSKRKK